jgi:hypothetical protein
VDVTRQNCYQNRLGLTAATQLTRSRLKNHCQGDAFLQPVVQPNWVQPDGMSRWLQPDHRKGVPRWPQPDHRRPEQLEEGRRH